MPAAAVSPDVPVVGNGELEGSFAVADRDFGACCARVFQRVRQGFLHDSVCREVDPGRKRPRLALDRDIDQEAGCSDVLDQRVEIGDARLRGELLLVLVTAEDSELPFFDRISDACRSAPIFAAS
jgi:hypothetical protein